ncbi:MAG: hypothetical protein H7837_03400 [Magnetococcus sp. MYC-9]
MASLERLLRLPASRVRVIAVWPDIRSGGAVRGLLFCALLGSMLSWPGLVEGGAPDWGTGFYRVNPSQEPAFNTEQNRGDDRRRLERSGSPATESAPRYAPDARSAPFRGSDGRDHYPETRRRNERPWGEVPPEWRNEDLERRLSGDGYAGGRRSSRYDAPDDYPGSLPEGELRGGRDGWDYPYPEREYRRRDPYAPYFEERFGRRMERRRPPPYYYEGGDAWWDAP